MDNLQLVRYGISLIWIVTGIIAIRYAYIEYRKRFFLSWNGWLAVLILAGAICLSWYDYRDDKTLLFLLKILASGFATIYGLFATVNDLYVQRGGRRVLTRIGKLGILFSISTLVLSIGSGVIQDQVDKRNAERSQARLQQRRDEYERRSDSLRIKSEILQQKTDSIMATLQKALTIDSSTGKVVINLAVFKNDLRNDINAGFTRTMACVDSMKLLVGTRYDTTLSLLAASQVRLHETDKILSEKESRLATIKAQLDEKNRDLENFNKENITLKKELSASMQTGETLRDDIARLKTEIERRDSVWRDSLVKILLIDSTRGSGF
jgi:hypothetical protein